MIRLTAFLKTTSSWHLKTKSYLTFFGPTIILSKLVNVTNLYPQCQCKDIIQKQNKKINILNCGLLRFFYNLQHNLYKNKTPFIIYDITSDFILYQETWTMFNYEQVYCMFNKVNVDFLILQSMLFQISLCENITIAVLQWVFKRPLTQLNFIAELFVYILLFKWTILVYILGSISNALGLI